MLHVAPAGLKSSASLLTRPTGLPPEALTGLSLFQLRVLFNAHKAAADGLNAVYNCPKYADEDALKLVDAEIGRHEQAAQDIIDLVRAMEAIGEDDRAIRADILLSYEAWGFDDSYLALAEAFIDGVDARNRRDIALHANRT